MVKFETENEAADNTYDATNVLLSKIKELLISTKERIKKAPQHPLHLQLKEEFFDLQLEIEFNGVDSRKQLFKNICKLIICKFILFVIEKESNSDIFEDDNTDTINRSRRMIYNKLGDRSFQNTTSTPVKSPLNSVSIKCCF